MALKRRNGLLQRLDGHFCGIIAWAMQGLRVRLGDIVLLRCFAAPSPLQLLALQRVVCETLLARVLTTTWSKCSRESEITLAPSKITTCSQSSTRTLHCGLPRCRSSEKRCRTCRSNSDPSRWETGDSKLRKPMTCSAPKMSTTPTSASSMPSVRTSITKVSSFSAAAGGGARRRACGA